MVFVWLVGCVVLCVLRIGQAAQKSTIPVAFIPIEMVCSDRVGWLVGGGKDEDPIDRGLSLGLNREAAQAGKGHCESSDWR